MFLPIPKLTEKDLVRFWAKVDVCGDYDCWNWLATCGSNGYGQFKINSRNYRAHRISLSLIQFIPTNLHVLHSCDNPLCCNPAHLWLGTDRDNVYDMLKKSRGATGERNGNAKLKDIDIPVIIELLKLHTQQEVANMFDVASRTISRVATGRTWKHISA